MTQPINTPTSSAAIRSVGPETARAASSLPPLDFDAIVERCGGNSRFASAIVGQFRATVAEEVQKIVAGLACANADAVRRAAHTAKSMSACVSADATAELARQIEDLGRTNRLQAAPQILDQLRGEVNELIAWIDRSGLIAGANIVAQTSQK